MTTTTKRICRTCPAVISAAGSSDQCRPCQQRSSAVRAAVAEAPTVQTPVLPSTPRTCETAGHHACRHFVAIYEYVKGFAADAEWCPICNVEAEGDDDVVHKIGCALIVLFNAEEARRLPAATTPALASIASHKE